jgi:hypothetical protein
VGLDEQALVEDLLQRPPDRLDVLGVHRAVGVVQVDPVPHPGRQLGEGVGVPGHRFTALGVELRDAVVLDVLLAAEAQLLLDRQLHREAVAVPAGLARHVVAAHGAEAGEDVLEDPGFDVVGTRHAVGGGRTLVEDPFGAALGLFEAAGEHLALAPEVEHRALQRWQVDLGGHLVVLHRRGFLRRTSRRCWSSSSVGGTRRLPLRQRTRGTTLLGGGLCPPPPHWDSAAGSTRSGELSSGGSGVIFTSRSPPGFHRPRVARGRTRTLLVPVIASRRPQCTGLRGPRWSGFRAAGRGTTLADRRAPLPSG